MQPVEHLPAAASDTVELVGAASSPPAGRCDGAGRVFATLGLQLERVQAMQAPGARVEVWFQDEARIGQKNSLTRVWGQTGSPPVAPKDLGFASAYLFGAVCPSAGKAAALIMPICNTAAMNHHLCEISSQVAADAHAVVILDGASWHNSHGLVVPNNITLLALPPYSPELNPVERIWHYLRSHWLANSVFPSLADIMDACETAWNRFAADHALIRPTEFVHLGIVADASGQGPMMPITTGAVPPRGTGLALMERVGIIEIDLPDGVRVRVDSGVNEKALRRVLSAVRRLG